METASIHCELDRHLAFVIDDEAEIRQRVATTLAERGYKTQSFITAKDALVAFGRDHPAVIFLDVALLQSDAIDVLIGLGAQKYGGIVNLMSGGRAELVEAVRRLGVRHGVTLAPSLNKPFGRAAIVQALAGIESLLAVSPPLPAQA
jgi:FixJ family two-component response regulator